MSTRFMMAGFVIGLALTCCLLSSPASADQVTSSTVALYTDYAQAITGVDIGGTPYDISFSRTDSTAPDPSPTGTTKNTAIELAADLNSYQQVGVITSTADARGAYDNRTSFTILTSNSYTSPVGWTVEYGTDPSNNLTDWYVDSNGVDSTNMGLFPIYQMESAVPEPNTAALLLVGFGLMSLAGLRRKLKGQGHIA